jgi:hypothetical protein
MTSKGIGFSNFVFAMMYFFLLVAGVSNFDGYNTFDATLIFESFFLIYSIFILFFLPRRKSILAIQVILVGYCALSFCVSYFVSDNDVRDFLQGNKAYFYCVMLSLFVGVKFFSFRLVWSILAISIIIFFLKYSVSVFFGFSERPGVFTENNFELPFLIIIFLAVYDRLGSRKGIVFLGLFVVVGLSGSRSAILSLCILYVFTFVSEFDRKIIFRLIFFLLLLGAAFSIFISRYDGDLYSIDRFSFFLVFLGEIETWEISNYVFGSMPMTPLSPSACEQLKYYEVLFSFAGDGSCYSVVLHSFVLRLIYDHGFFGLVLLAGTYLYLFAKVSLPRKKVWCFLLIAFVNAMSVSSLNNIYFAIAVVVLMSSQTWRQVSSEKIIEISDGNS